MQIDGHIINGLMSLPFVAALLAMPVMFTMGAVEAVRGHGQRPIVHAALDQTGPRAPSAADFIIVNEEAFLDAEPERSSNEVVSQ